MHIGRILRQKLEEEGKTVTWLAVELGCHRTNIYHLFAKYSIDTQTLQRLCLILNYNFFRLYEKEVADKIK